MSPPASPANRIPFLGTAFDPLALDSAVEAILSCASGAAHFCYVATPNVDHLVRLSRDSDALAPLYSDAWLVLCDSKIVQVLASLSGLTLPAAPGADIAARLFDGPINPDEPVTLIGGTPLTARLMVERYGLKALAHHTPPMGLRTNHDAIEAVVDFVISNPARFVFLCVGSPQQEIVARAIMARGGATGVGLCVGAALEFLTGEKARAPQWMRASRLEWLHRLMSEPARLWRRYLIDGPAILAVWWRWQKSHGRAAV